MKQSDINMNLIISRFDEALAYRKVADLLRYRAESIKGIDKEILQVTARMLDKKSLEYLELGISEWKANNEISS